MAKSRRYSLREEKRRIARENPPIEFVLDEDEQAEGDPRVMRLIAAPMWSDEILTLSKSDPIEAARQIAHDDEDDLYDEFVKQGGSAQLLFTVAGQENQGASAGE